MPSSWLVGHTQSRPSEIPCEQNRTLEDDSGKKGTQFRPFGPPYLYIAQRSRNSSVNIRTGLLSEWNGFDSRRCMISLFSTAKLKVHPSAYIISSWGESWKSVKLTTHLRLMLGSRKVELYFQTLVYLYGLVCN
jgi:hypothetical protein